MNSFYHKSSKDKRKAGFYKLKEFYYLGVRVEVYAYYGEVAVKVRYFQHTSGECWTVEVMEKPLAVKTFDCPDFDSLTKTLALLGFEIR